MSVALDFLRAWHPGGPWSIGAVDPDDSEGHAWLTTSDEAAAEKFLDEQGAQKRNLYYQINVCRPDLGGMRAYESSVIAAVAVHAEVDPPESVREKSTAEERLAALEAWQLEHAQRATSDAYWSELGLPRPSLVVFSGTGFQFAWRLAEPVVLWTDSFEQDPTKIELVEARNRKLVEVLGADSASTDVSRLLRLPGTQNWPGDSKRKKYGRAEPVGAELLELDVERVVPVRALPAAASRSAPSASTVRPLPAFAGLPADDDLLTAVDALASAWPSVGRHQASLALCGALARQGWPAEHVAEFVAAVCDAAEPGNADYLKRLAAAQSSVSKVVAGEAVQGWPSLEQHVGRAAIDAACAALGVNKLPAPDEKFMAAIASIAAAQSPPPASAPTRVDREASYKSIAKKLSLRKDPDSLRDAELLRRVARGEFLTDASEPDEARVAALVTAAVAVVRSAPVGTLPEQLVDDLTPSAGALACDLRDQIVPMAIARAAELPSILIRAPRALGLVSGESAELLGDFVLSKKSGDEEGHPVPSNAHNMRLACAKLGVEFQFDRFAGTEIMVRGEERSIVEDQHVNALSFEIERTFGFFPPVDKFYRFCGTLAREHSYHPVLDYFDALPAWDGVPRAETWLVDLAGAQDTPFVRAISRMFLVAAVRRIRRPGCKFDEMLILETPDQGKFKSKALRALAVRDEWFSDEFELDADRRELMETTGGIWIIEAGELKGLGNKDHNKLKAYLSRQEDRARLAYDRKVHRVKRQFVVFGTTNEEHYLSDPTGNRRYLPVRVREFDVPRLIAARDQLWAEAAALDLAHPEDEYIRLDPSLYKVAAAEQEKRRAQDSIHVELADALADVTGHLRVQDVYKIVGFGGDKRPSKAQEQSICAAMRVLGWENLGQLRLGGIRGTYYARGTELERQVLVSVKTDYGIAKVEPGRPVSPAVDTVNQGSVPVDQGTN